MSGGIGRACAALLLCVFAPALQAHLLNMTRVQVTIGADDRVDVSMSLDLTRAAGSSLAYYRLSQSPAPLTDPDIAPKLTALTQAMAVRLDDILIPLQLSAARLPQLAESEFLNPVTWPMTEVELHGQLPPGAAAGSGSLQVRFDPAFPYEEPIALTLQASDGTRRMTRWLVAGQMSPRFGLRQAPPGAGTEVTEEAAWRTLGRYLVFGFKHILPGGLDHLLFVLGLYLGTRRLRRLLLLVTTFTLAHSTTLILSSFGVVRLPAGVVEPLIALSIAWVGIENLLPHRQRAGRVILVFAFGLLHGLGFAAALKELGLPPAHFLGALLSFNLGVEFGQLAVIGIALLLTLRWRQHPRYRPWLVLPGSLAIALLALVWTVQRLVE